MVNSTEYNDTGERRSGKREKSDRLKRKEIEEEE